MERWKRGALGAAFFFERRGGRVLPDTAFLQGDPC